MNGKLGTICQHCGGQMAIANPTGFCSHIHYPEGCAECALRLEFKPVGTIQGAPVLESYSVEEMDGIRILVGGYQAGKTITARLFATVSERDRTITNQGAELAAARKVIVAAENDVKYADGCRCALCEAIAAYRAAYPEEATRE